tara:strand:+ start:6539 stop:7162 length:624 start_codon:yes stop_codon:yes gene_type:complete
MSLIIRKANKNDSKFLLDLKNDADALKNSLINKAVSKSEHTAWYEKKLQDHGTKIFIFENDFKKKVGFVRFDQDKSNTTANVSIAISKEFRGKRYAQRMLQQGIKEISKIQPLVFLATVKADNESSLRAFKSSGFGVEENNKKLIKLSNKQTIIDAIEMVRNRNNINWMNLLRLAFKTSPNDAGEIMGKINSDDTEISKLLGLLSKK